MFRVKSDACKRVILDSRRLFTPAQKAALLSRADGCCELCGEQISCEGAGWVAGHIIAHSLGGRTVISNGRVEGIDCGCARTTAKNDTKVAAKAKRQAGLTGQRARRERNGSKLTGRGFDKTLRKKFDGTVERVTK